MAPIERSTEGAHKPPYSSPTTSPNGRRLRQKTLTMSASWCAHSQAYRTCPESRTAPLGLAALQFRPDTAPGRLLIFRDPHAGVKRYGRWVDNRVRGTGNQAPVPVAARDTLPLSLGLAANRRRISYNPRRKRRLPVRRAAVQALRNPRLSGGLRMDGSQSSV